MLEYKPIAHPEVSLAVVVTEVNDIPSALRIYLRTQMTIATPATYITANSLVPEVLSRAGLPETYTLSNYAVVSSETRGQLYFYVISADVTVA